VVFIVGSRLKELRKEKRITQKALGAILGVRETTISLYETDVNDPSDSIKVMIANHFGVSLDYLLGVIEEQVTPYSKDKYIMLTQEIDDEERSLLL